MTKTIFFIGLSHKVDKTGMMIPAFSPDTSSGKILQGLREKLPEITFHFTNLAKVAPLDSKGKLRYPNQQEMESGFYKLEKEIKILKPDLVFLCGNLVEKFMKQHFSLADYPFIQKMLKIYHPSYISTYRKQHTESYLNEIIENIETI